MGDHTPWPPWESLFQGTGEENSADSRTSDSGEQCGFRPGRGTLDVLYTLRRVLEGSWESAQPVHMCFVDLEKAFDRVPCGILWEVLRVYGPCENGAGASLSEVSQTCSHCPLTPILFIVFMDRIYRCSQGPERVWFGSQWISSLLISDDAVLLAPSSGWDQHLQSEAMVLNWEKVGCSL